MSTQDLKLDLSWLQQFCNKEEGRVSIGEPFHHEGYAYACNGHIAVRIPCEPFGDTWSASTKETVLKSFAREGGVWWTVVPPLQSPIKKEACEPCGGSGTAECHACGHEEDCVDCDGTGEIEIQASVDIGGVIFDVGNIGRVWSLPGFRILVRAGGDLLAHRFEFEGGSGVLMPLRRNQPIHIEVEQAREAVTP